MSKPRGVSYCGISSDENLLTSGAASGMRGGLSLPMRRSSGTWESETARHGSMMRSPRLVLLAVLLVCTDHCQAQTDRKAAESHNSATILAGLLLASDLQCDEWPAADVHKGERICQEGSSRWGLITLERQYSVRGKTSQLMQYERHRVTVTGSVSPDHESFMVRLDVQSIGPSEMPESQIRGLIEQLKRDQWAAPENIANPTTWVFHFTPPMLQILQAGPAAQDVLLRYLDDPNIKDQIIILLGGLGDGKAVLPIIHAMANQNEAGTNSYARKVNLAANLALTNITVGDVIWRHGGGITMDACPDDPKSCWYTWWIQHRYGFDISKSVSRNYSNYPSYGIYQDPGLFRLGLEWH
jgi:hypothetical protein